MREIRTYGSMRGLQTEAARGPVRSSRVRRTVLDHSGLIPLRSTLLREKSFPISSQTPLSKDR